MDRMKSHRPAKSAYPLQSPAGSRIAMARVQTTPNAPSTRGISILAKSLFREMQEQGYSKEHIIGLSSELLHLVSSDLRADIEPAQ